MNAAFAIGRLCDMEQGRRRLLGLPDSEKMVIFAQILKEKRFFATKCMKILFLRLLHVQKILRMVSVYINIYIYFSCFYLFICFILLGHTSFPEVITVLTIFYISFLNVVLHLQFSLDKSTSKDVTLQ